MSGQQLFFSRPRRHYSNGLHSERLMQPLCTILRSGPVPQTVTVPPQIKKIPFPFPEMCISSVLQLLLLPLVTPLSRLFSLLFPSLSLGASQQYQLHHRCFYTCFWTSWACNKDTVLYTVLYSKIHKSTTTCRGCVHMTMYTRHVN